MQKDNTGFTIIETIAVIIILAVLMSIVVPSMLSYFDRDEEDFKNDAQLILLSAQNKFAKLYIEGSHGDKNNCIISGPATNLNDPSGYVFNNNQNLDCDIHKNTLAAEIFKDAGFDINKSEPYAVIVGTGRYDIYAADPTSDEYDPKKAYTIYSVTYLNTLKDEVWFWTSDKGFTKKKPYKKDKVGNLNYYNNVTEFEGETIKIQYYMIKSGSANDKTADEVWKELQKHYNAELNPDA